MKVSQLYGLLILLLIFACRGQMVEATSKSESKADSVSMDLIQEDLYGGSQEKTLEVFKDQESLKKFYAQLNKSRKPGLRAPSVDFDEVMLLLYCPGNTTEILDMEAASLLIKEENLEFQPPAQANQEFTNSALLQPFYLYKLPLDERQIVLKE